MHVFYCCPDSVAWLPNVQVFVIAVCRWVVHCAIHECSNNEHDRHAMAIYHSSQRTGHHHGTLTTWDTKNTLLEARWYDLSVGWYRLRHPGNSCGFETENNFWKKVCNTPLPLGALSIHCSVITVLTCDILLLTTMLHKENKNHHTLSEVFIFKYMTLY